MTTRMKDLPDHLKATEIFFIGSGEAENLHSLCPALIDRERCDLEFDIALLFSSIQAARQYQSKYQSLRKLDIFQATIAEMIEIFNDKVEHFMVKDQDYV